MKKAAGILKTSSHLLAGGLVLFGLYSSSLYSYLLFHTLVELFSVLTAFAIFALAWHTRKINDNHYLLFIGIASLFTGALDLAHTLAYKGMGVFPEHGANPPTQLWIAFRFMFSVSFLLSTFFIGKKLRPGRVFILYALACCTLAAAIFLGWFPVCYREGSGLSSFKIVSEYIICLILFAALLLLIRRRAAFDPLVLRLMVLSLVFSIATEISFTEYASVYGFANLLGHLFLLISVALIYRAIVVTGVVEPSRLLFRDLKKSEEKIQTLNIELKHHIGQLETANRELESFSYSVSHDLRAPLRAIDGFSHALQEECRDQLSGAGHEYLLRIRAAVGKMGQLIDSLLNLSRLSRSELKSVPCDLSSLVKSKAEELRRMEPDRSADFFITEGISARGDPTMIRSVIDNLLGNAWKFTGKMQKTRIEFGVMKNDGREVYFVRDNGVGFDMAYSKKLFTAFQRLHSADEFPGIGIGLATVNRIINRHGGEIWARGEVDKGATFFFTLSR